MRVRLIAEQAAGFAILAALLYYWSGLADGSTAQFLWSLALLAMVAAGAVALTLRAVHAARALSDERRSLGRIALAALLLAFVAAGAYRLVWWVPKFGGFAAQLGSMLVRFGLAYLVLIVAWVELIAAISRGRPRASQPETSPNP